MVRSWWKMAQLRQSHYHLDLRRHPSSNSMFIASVEVAVKEAAG
jgi:hypothetical protein